VGKSIIKFGIWAFTALTGLASIIRWILDAIGTAQTAGGVYENRGPILNWLATVPHPLPVTLFLMGVFALACIQFGSPAGWLAAITNESPKKRQALLIKIRDLVFVAPKQPVEERVDVIGALIRFSDEFKNEKHVVWTCDELAQRGFENPFKLLESRAPGIFRGRKLEFLGEARTGMIDVRRIPSAWSFAAKYWTHADDYIKAQRKFTGFPESEPEPKTEPVPATASKPKSTPADDRRRRQSTARADRSKWSVVEPEPPKQTDKSRVGFLQLDRIEYHREKTFIPEERFAMTFWFTNRGQFPAYRAQVFALLCYAPTVYDTVNDDMCRELKKAITAQWEKGEGSQVAVGGSIFFKTEIKAMPQAQINRVMSGEGRIYLATRARWSNDAGEEVTPAWEACSYLEPPASADANPLTLKWHIVS
jgi:hypothetical protein